MKIQKNSVYLWIAVVVVILTFLFLDASALAWSSKWIGGQQIVAAIFTFFVLVSGALITVWKMKVN